MKIKYLASVFGVLSICSAPVLAGFEWVPPPQRTRAVPAPVFTPEPLFTPAPIARPADIAIPSPVTAPITMPAPKTHTLAPVSLSPIVVPQAPIKEELYIRRSRIAPTDSAPVFTPVTAEVKPGALSKIEDIDFTQPPLDPPMRAPSPRVILPMDAPQSADANIGNSKRLSISPYPVSESQIMPQDSFDAMAMVPADATPKKFIDLSPVNGFGSDLPLALALGQIVPSDYAYSFAAGVNPGARISWNGGGKQWGEVLNEALAPLGYGLKIRGKQVVITAS